MSIRLCTLVACCLLLIACGDDDDVGTSDRIDILSVTPDTLVDGEMSTIEVEVSYDCNSYEMGVIYVGCNSYEVDTYSLLGHQMIERGSGVITIEITATAKNWGSAGSFRIMANLSDAEHGDSWSPAAADFQAVTVTSVQQAQHADDALLFDQ